MFKTSDTILIIKNVAELVKKYKDKGLNEEIIHLQEINISLSDQYLELRESIEELKEKTSSNDKVSIDDDGFIRIQNDPNRYCPKCWSKDIKLSIMPKHGVKSEYGDGYIFQCSACNFPVTSQSEYLSTFYRRIDRII